MTKFQIVPNRSQLLLKGRSNLHPLSATTTGLKGYLEAEVIEGGRLDPNVAPTGRIEIAVESFEAGTDLYDLEMRRRLDIRRYPTIVAELLEIRDLSEGNRYHAVGNISYRGITRRFEGELRIVQIDDHTLGINGEQTFDVRDFGVTPPKLFMFETHPEVQVTLKVVAKWID